MPTGFAAASVPSITRRTEAGNPRYGTGAFHPYNFGCGSATPGKSGVRQMPIGVSVSFTVTMKNRRGLWFGSWRVVHEKQAIQTNIVTTKEPDHVD